MEKQGTEWTEPGQGATIEETLRALPPYGWIAGASKYVRQKPGRAAAERWLYALAGHFRQSGAGARRTNLRLTGDPLTAEDLQRIAECK